MAAKAKTAAPKAADQAESLKFEWVPIQSLKPHPRNSRQHSDDQVKLLRKLLREFGWMGPIKVDETSTILAGHGIWMAAQLEGHTQVPVARKYGLSDAQKRAYVIADNKSAMLSEWDVPVLKTELGELKSLGFDLNLTGFGKLEVVEFLALPAGEGEGGGEHRGESATVLKLIDITIADPKTEVHQGDIWQFAGKHLLYCASVITDWQKWRVALTDGALFCPYPGAFVPFGDNAATHKLVMVQPDPYICGHIIDRWKDVHGAKAVKMLERVHGA